MAPDESSRKSGKELAVPTKWGRRAYSKRALWGECQGSGKSPYQTQIDLTNVAFKCSCPSRKFPCKHGLGLLLLFARDPKSFTTESEPTWVTDWLDRRAEREETKIEKQKEKKVDPVAQAKRQENRLKRVEDGVSELRLWIKDIIRNGLIGIPSKDFMFFENMTRRMVDAQAPGLSSMIRSLAEINFYADGWQSQFLDQLIRIYLVIEGFSRMDELPDHLREEVKSLIGFSQNQEELKKEDGLRDNWFVLAKRVTKEENLTTERNWLVGEQSKKFALILQFYVKGQFPELNLLPGSVIDAELVFFKGANTSRALVKNQYGMKTTSVITGQNTWRQVLFTLTTQHAVNPWATQHPVIIENVIPLKNQREWLLIDQNGEGVRISSRFEQHWKLLAISGGKPLTIFAIGRETSFEPLAAWEENNYKSLI